MQPNSSVTWGGGEGVVRAAATGSTAAVSQPTKWPEEPPISIDDLRASTYVQAGRLTEWLKLALDEPALLESSAPSRIWACSSPDPPGRQARLVRAVCANRHLVRLDGPDTGALAPTNASRPSPEPSPTSSTAAACRLSPDVDALLPDPPEPVATMILGELRKAVCNAGCRPGGDLPGARRGGPTTSGTGSGDRELGVSLPDGATRKALLEVLLRDVPAKDVKLDEIADRTPGFVRADLAALIREAALRAAARASDDGQAPVLTQEDLTGALSVIRPLSRSNTEELSVGSVTLEDVGDMVATKQALTEAIGATSAPDTFARLGVETARRAALRPPAWARRSSSVRWPARATQRPRRQGRRTDGQVGGVIGKAVRELFRRARDSAPSLIFLDGSTHSHHGAVRASTRVSPTGWWPRC